MRAPAHIQTPAAARAECYPQHWKVLGRETSGMAGYSCHSVSSGCNRANSTCLPTSWITCSSDWQAVYLHIKELSSDNKKKIKSINSSRSAQLTWLPSLLFSCGSTRSKRSGIYKNCICLMHFMSM